MHPNGAEKERGRSRLTREQKLDRNRKSAQLSRERKVKLFLELSEQIDILKKENEKLRAKLAASTNDPSLLKAPEYRNNATQTPDHLEVVVCFRDCLAGTEKLL